MKTATKIEIECEMLRTEHDIRNARGNKRAHLLSAEMSTGEEHRRNIEAAAYHRKREEAAEKSLLCMQALIEAPAYHDLTVREAATDRAWAEKLSAAA